MNNTLVFTGEYFKQTFLTNKLNTMETYNYNTPISKDEIILFDKTDNGKTKVYSFIYNGKYYKYKYNYGKNYSFFVYRRI